MQKSFVSLLLHSECNYYFLHKLARFGNCEELSVQMCIHTLEARLSSKTLPASLSLVWVAVVFGEGGRSHILSCSYAVTSS